MQQAWHDFLVNVHLHNVQVMYVVSSSTSPSPTRRALDTAQTNCVYQLRYCVLRQKHSGSHGRNFKIGKEPYSLIQLLVGCKTGPGFRGVSATGKNWGKCSGNFTPSPKMVFVSFSECKHRLAPAMDEN